jgi:hypothetical protein
MDDSISVDITPDKSLIQKLGLVGYRTVQAIAELLDNSIDARIENQEEKIHVQLNFEEKLIVVQDDGHGMDKDDLKNAMTIAKGTKSDGSLGQFGIGLKSACSALGKTFVIRTSKVDSNKEFVTTYDEDTWLTDDSLDWTNFKIIEKTLSPKENWHGTIILIGELKVPLYATQVTKFKENYGIRYAPYLQDKQVSIQINTGFCKPITEDIEEESKIEIDIPLSEGKSIRGYVALLKKRSVKGYYGINLIKNGRLIKSFDKFGFSAHPENAKIIGELNLDHVPVNFYKSEFIEESKEYQEVLKAFVTSEILKQILHSSQSKGSVTASIESVFDYFGTKSRSKYLEHSVRTKLAQELLNNTEPFEVKLGKNIVEIVIKSLKNESLYTINNSDSKINVVINKDNPAFKFVKNPLFLIGMIASEIKLFSDNPNFGKLIQERNNELKEFLETWSEKSDKKEIFRDREVPIPDMENYNLADELVGIHDYLKENFEFKFQFTALSTLTSYLHNLRGKLVYTLYTTPEKGEYLAELLAEKFHKKFTIVHAPDRKALDIFLKMPTTERIIAIREYAVIQGATIATPEKAFLDLVNEVHSHDGMLDELELRRIFATMKRSKLINYENLHTYAKFLKKSELLEKILGDELQW